MWSYVPFYHFDMSKFSNFVESQPNHFKKKKIIYSLINARHMLGDIK